MVKFWSLLFVLILAILSLSRGNITTPAPQEGALKHMAGSSNQSTSAKPELPQDDREMVSPSPQNHPPVNATVPPTTTNEQTGETNTTDTAYEDDVTTEEVTIVPKGGKEDDRVASKTTVPPTTAKTTAAPGVTNPVITEESTSWGYVILVLIIVVIIALCLILYSLRRASRSYSFDLQRPVPVNHLSEPTGTFEAVYLDDLDRPAPEDHTSPDELQPPPAVNGTTPQSEEKGANGEKAPEEKPDANGLKTSVNGDTSPTPGDDPADKTSSPLSSTDLLFEAAGEEQHNENNNNPSVCSSDPFVEINLDDPAWCDQLFNSPDAPSSVLPFSPFSFRSSTSSS